MPPAMRREQRNHLSHGTGVGHSTKRPGILMMCTFNPAPTGQNKSAQGNPPWVSEASPWESARRARRARCRDRDPRGVRRWQSRGARSRGKSSGERQASDRPGSFAMIHRSEPARSTVAESCRDGRGMMILSPPSSCLSLKEASLESSHARHHRNHR
jgi:hypothetical protein